MEIKKFTKQFQEALANQCGVIIPSSVLVAVSGGADSMALLHLLKNAEMECLAVHCNFTLRGSESDRDEEFVKKTCNEWNVEYICKQFDTNAYAKQKGLSIEMAARELRYDLFQEVCRERNLDYIATGHHGDDAIETFFLNLTRGTGLKGLTGIAWQREQLIRPLLFAKANDIKAYCEANSIEFRTDASNDETTFIRNKIRHQLIPVLNEINPAFFKTMQNNMHYLKEAWELFLIETKNVRNQMVSGDEDSLLIPIKLINNHPQKKSMLFDILHPYGFPGGIMDNVIESMNGIPGKQFFTSTHRLVIDRYNLLLVPRQDGDDNEYTINGDQISLEQPIRLSIQTYAKPEAFTFSIDPAVVHLDADLIDFPLMLRRSKPGDRFQPLGMEQFKKISDFFVDQKLSLIEKEKTWLLLQGDDIVWVIGHRIDNRYKISSRTKNILEIKLL